VFEGDIKIVAKMLRNLEKFYGKVEFKSPLVVTAPTYNIIDELKEEGDWEILQKYSGFEFDDAAPKSSARTEYENILYLERPGCNLCMGNQEKAEKGDTVMATSTRLFQGRVVKDSDRKKGESLLASTPVVVLSAILGRTPTIKEYKLAVKDIKLTQFLPPLNKMTPQTQISNEINSIQQSEWPDHCTPPWEPSSAKHDSVFCFVFLFIFVSLYVFQSRFRLSQC
jgi:aconitate hydratase 2/2-methylisocitrate dehydratase